MASCGIRAVSYYALPVTQGPFDMYSFFILLPLTLISLGVGWIISLSPQVRDYIEYATDVPDQAALLLQIWTDRRLWGQVGAHMLAYIVLCFVTIATVRTVSPPLPAHSAGLRKFQLFLEILFVSLPSTVLLWIVGRKLIGDQDNWICWLAVAVLSIGLTTSVAITVRRTPLELYNSFAQPYQITKTDVGAALSAIVIFATIAAFAIYPQYSAYHVGIFSAIMLMTAAIFLGVAAIFSRHSSPVAIISSLITGVLLLYFINFLPAREFRYSTVALSGSDKLEVEDAKRLRNIPDLTTAFHQWLEYRRPAIEEYNKKGKAYPIFFVSAQGGGMYAAYHPALSLARLTDYCPEFAHHLFGISSVSGGSLGAAVYAELMRSLPAADRGDPAAPVVGCSRFGPISDYNVLETGVRKFFKSDFLSRVVASAFLFDVPSAFVPLLRFQHDRAWALEFGFEEAWRGLAPARPDAGLSTDFLGRWNATEPAPALFMATTGVNFGIPVLISQIDWSFNPSSRTRSKQPPQGTGAFPMPNSADLVKRVTDRLDREDDPLRIGIANLLDFRPDVQLATSTAVVLSARFPFVTPPGNIAKSERFSVAPGSVFEKIRELQLTDGGFYDNSGGIVARDLIGDLNKKLESDERLKSYRNLIKFHLIRFTDTPAKRQALVSEKAYPELISPLVAYNTVRVSRGVPLATPARTTVSNIYLLDEWYDGVLNWLLAGRTELDIQKRSSWQISSDNTVCCEVRRASSTTPAERIPLTDEEEKELGGVVPPFSVRRFVPNSTQFDSIFRNLNPDASRSLWHPEEASAPVPPSPVQ